MYRLECGCLVGAPVEPARLASLVPTVRLAPLVRLIGSLRSSHLRRVPSQCEHESVLVPKGAMIVHRYRSESSQISYQMNTYAPSGP